MFERSFDQSWNSYYFDWFVERHCILLLINIAFCVNIATTSLSNPSFLHGMVGACLYILSINTLGFSGSLRRL